MFTFQKILHSKHCFTLWGKKYIVGSNNQHWQKFAFHSLAWEMWEGRDGGTEGGREGNVHWDCIIEAMHQNAYLKMGLCITMATIIGFFLPSRHPWMDGEKEKRRTERQIDILLSNYIWICQYTSFHCALKNQIFLFVHVCMYVCIFPILNCPSP